MTRDDALRKVRSLLALAARTNEHEAEVANAAAVRLRLRHGIADDELVDENEEEVEILGMKLFWYSRKIKPRVEAIRDEIQRAKTAMSAESLRAQLEHTAKLYEDLRVVLDYKSNQRQGLKQDRDDLVRAYYEEQLKSWFDEEDDEVSVYAHRTAVSYTSMACDLRKDHVERIVGRSEKKMWEAQLKLLKDEKEA